MLSDTTIKNAKPREKPFKVFDERGLYLLVAPTGSKGWRFRYAHGGREKLLSLGLYPMSRSNEPARNATSSASSWPTGSTPA